MNISPKEEDYLKLILELSKENEYVSTNSLALHTKTSAPAVTDMIQRMSKRQLVIYKKYNGVKLSKKGQQYSNSILRRQYLWQCFLAYKLKLEMNDVSDISQGLKHINSEILTNRLDDFLGNPLYSPFGKPIPNKDGITQEATSMTLSEIELGQNVIVTAIKESNNPHLLQYFYKKGIYIGAKLIIIEKLTFDDSFDISIDNQPKVNISSKISENIIVKLS